MTSLPGEAQMHGHGQKLMRKQERVIAALLSEPTVTAAAEKAGVGERTLRRWLLLPDFQDAFRAARRQIVEDALSQLQGATGEAVATLRRNLKCGRAGDEIRAAIAILDQSSRATELIDLQERLTALESRTVGPKRCVS